MKIKITDNFKIDGKMLFIIIAILVVIVYFGFLSDGQQDNGPSLETVKCIASKSTLYISTGCHACAAQEAIFGEKFDQLNYVDCMIEGDKCGQYNITRVPTWIIDGESYMGVQEIENLISLTGC